MNDLLSMLWRASWQATVLFAIVAIFVKLTPRLSASVHCWAYRLVCIKFLVALVVAGAVRLPVLPATSDTFSANLTVTAKAKPIVADQPIETMAIGGKTASQSNPSLGDVATADSASTIPATTTTKWFSWQGLLITVWLAGVAWQLVKLIRDAKRLLSIRSAGQLLEDNHPVERLLRQETINLQVSPCPELRTASTTTCPAVVGFVSACVVLPNSVLKTSTDEEIRLLLRHELAHLSRKDLWWNWLAATTQLLFFFHPIVWITLREWRMHQESACDEMAIGSPPEDSAAYASLLMEIALSKNPTASLTCAAGIFESFETLKRRIEKMSHFGSCSKRHQFVAIAMAMAIAVVGVPPWKLVPASAAVTPTENTTSFTAVKNGAKNQRNVDNSKATTNVKGHRISVAGVADLSGMKYQHRTDFSKILINRTIKTESSKAKFKKKSADGNSTAAGSAGGFGGIAGGGGGAAIRFAGTPKLGIALKIPDQPGTMYSLIGGLSAIDEKGKTHKSLPTSGVHQMVIPEFETAQKGNLVAYFTKSALVAKSFKQIKGQLLVEEAACDKHIRKVKQGLKWRTKLGEYQITKVQRANDRIQVALRYPLPKSVQKILDARPKNADAFRKKVEARRQLASLVRFMFVDEEGNEYQPNSIGSHGSGESFSTTTETKSSNGFRMKSSSGNSSQKKGTQEKIFGMNKIPGVRITRVSIQISEVPTSSETIDFELKNVQLKR